MLRFHTCVAWAAPSYTFLLVANPKDAVGAFQGYIATGTTASKFDLSFVGAMGTQAFGINNHGEIVGDYTDSMGTMHGFVYIGGVFYTVDDPSAAPGTAVINGVNDLGQMVGFCYGCGPQHNRLCGHSDARTGHPFTDGLRHASWLGFLRHKLMR